MPLSPNFEFQFIFLDVALLLHIEQKFSNNSLLLPFSLDCFSDLSRLVVELSEEYSGNLPIEPKADILAKIPSDLPNFLENTPASREIRFAYIQHIIFRTLTYRIFQPFLFTLGRRYDKADTLFRLLSSDIRRKSVRREAFWRQQTLRAAYSSPDAKKSINVVAQVIVEEIVDHIRHFTDPDKFDQLVQGVRSVVKLAAETWRLARVERELVIANMPAGDGEVLTDEGWKEYHGSNDASQTPPPESSDSPAPKRRALLRVCPRIHREAVHEDFAMEDADRSNCVYLPGVVLYADSPAVVARRMEIAKKRADPMGTGDGGSALPPPPTSPHTPPPESEVLGVEGSETPVAS